MVEIGISVFEIGISTFEIADEIMERLLTFIKCINYEN